jgi:hypothetical protein
MSQVALDKFGQLLIKRVRDEAVTDWKMMIDGRMKGASAEKVREFLGRLSEADKKLFSQLIPGVVDTVLHHLLWTVEQESDLYVGVETDNGIENLREISDGLPGELYSDEGWIARFSKEDRFLY